MGFGLARSLSFLIVLIGFVLHVWNSIIFLITKSILSSIRARVPMQLAETSEILS